MFPCSQLLAQYFMMALRKSDFELLFFNILSLQARKDTAPSMLLQEYNFLSFALF
jgi:hypothetical protein